ncbi:hypothetical protein [Sphingomonas sp. ID0503]|uniref:hypothetical protein n=1 Tax=Sphingomonas sp. ID0503 TaxID=3399691 RepID=UPI003AFA5988
MRTLIFLALLLSATAADAAPGCRVVNTLPAFARFSAATRTFTPDQRADLFVRDLAPRLSAYYLVGGITRPEELREPARLFFAGGAAQPGLRPFDPAAFAVMQRLIGRDFAGMQRRFLAAFPDFRCTSDIVFGVSLGRFDGAMIPGPSRSTLLFGVDVISRLQSERTLPVLIHHEMFHLYHRQLQPAAFARDPLPVWWGAWSEGLAAYASGRLNPGVPAAALFGTPPDLPERIAARRAETAGLVLDNLDATGETYAKLFTANDSFPGYPPRAGYWFGYRLAVELGRTRSVTELALLPPEDVRTSLEELLRQESRAP